MLFLDELIKIENMLDLGKYNDAKKMISDLHPKITDKGNTIDLEILFARYLRETGNAKESERLTDNLIIKAKELQNSLLLTKTYIENAYDNWYLGFHNKSIERGLDALNLSKRDKSKESQVLTAKSNNLIGNVEIERGNSTAAINYYTVALQIHQEHGNKMGSAYVLNNLGFAYSYLGRLNAALSHYEKSKDLFTSLDNEHLIAISMGNIGQIYILKGNLEKALELSLKSISVLERIGNAQSLAEFSTNIGQIYHAKGELEKAIKYYKKSLDILLHQDNDVWVSFALFYYILANADYDLEEAKIWLEKLRSFLEVEDRDTSLIQLRYNIAAAVLLIKTSRLTNLVKAESLLKEILNNDTVDDYSITILAIKNLADIRLVELRLFTDSVNLKELLDLIAKMTDLSKLHGSFITETQSLILYAKLKLIEGEFEVANSSLNEALIIAKNHGLVTLANEINEEIKKLYNEVNKYETMFRDSKIMELQIEVGEVREYLNKILSSGILRGKRQN